MRSLILAAVCISVAVVWGVYRNEDRYRKRTQTQETQNHGLPLCFTSRSICAVRQEVLTFYSDLESNQSELPCIFNVFWSDIEPNWFRKRIFSFISAAVVSVNIDLSCLLKTFSLLSVISVYFLMQQDFKRSSQKVQ